MDSFLQVVPSQGSSGLVQQAICCNSVHAQDTEEAKVFCVWVVVEVFRPMVVGGAMSYLYG
eukprot:2088727-Amphidinium_carterae.1